MTNSVQTVQYPYRTFTRPKKDRVVAGVAAGLSQQLRVDVLLVRLVLVFFALLSGAGLLFYACLWIWTKPGDTSDGSAYISQDDVRIRTKHTLNRAGYLVLVVVAIAGALLSFSSLTGFAGANVVPFGVVGVGALVVWTTYDRGLDRLWNGNNALLIVAGVLLMGIGVVLVTINWESQKVFGSTLVAVVLTLLGVAALGLPLWLRTWDALTKERSEIAAAAEREEIASRLHDSVLQTLALIQKRAEEPSEVARLARSQERELRQWLFGSQDNLSGGASTVFKAVELACGEVEDLFGLRIAPVLVGEDHPLDDHTQAAVLASREAMVNAAKHAGVAEINVYAESLGEHIQIYVRDRGAGFNPDEVGEDRHGLRESIYGRVERAGGTVEVKTGVGQGTEIVVDMPI